MSAILQNSLDDRRLGTLMQAAQAGNTDAYLELLAEIVPRIRRMVRAHWRFLGAEDVEDIVQDALLSLHAVRATYDPERSFMPWLLAIIRNRIADGARRYRRREAQEVHVEDWTVTFSRDSANSSAKVYGDLDMLLRAIQALPAAQRAAIEMLKLREMSLKEAATRCGVSVGSLKVATHRAMATLRKKLRSDA